MGGMTAAALLAKTGKRVLVLEQHYVPGGFTHTFKRPKYRWDVGVHAVGEVTQHSFPGRVLAALSDNQLEWASLGPVYDEFHFPDGLRIDFPDNPTAFRENLLRAFPGEQPAIDEYLARVRNVAKSMKGYYLARLFPRAVASVTDRLLARGANTSLQERTRDVIEGLTDDPRLRTVLAAQWGYYGSPPSRSSFAIQALVVRHFQWGGYYPVGGSKEIADRLLSTVRKAGGATAVRAEVTEILVEEGRAVGVRLATGEEIHAKKIVSAVGPLATVQRLLPEQERRKPWAASLEKLAPSSAHVCLYLGFRGDIRKVGASAANKWFYEDWDTEHEAWDVANPEALAPVLYCSFPSLKDPAHDAPEQRHTGEVVTFVPYDVFEPWAVSRWKKRGDAYNGFKDQLKDRLLKQFLRHMPELEEMIDFAELSTPLSTEHFVRPVAGSIYGLEPTPERFLSPHLRPRTPLPGLYFAGSDVATVGVIGAMMGGALAAAAADPWRVLPYLRRFM